MPEQQDPDANDSGRDSGRDNSSGRSDRTDCTSSTTASTRDVDAAITRYPHCTVDQVLRSIRGRTTLMLRDIPAAWTTGDVLELLSSLDLSVDYIYLPREGLRGKGSTGYAFANFNQAEVNRVVQTLHGFTVEGFLRPISVRAAMVQGIAANLAHFSSVHGRSCYENHPWIRVHGRLVGLAPSAAIKALHLEDQVAQVVLNTPELAREHLAPQAAPQAAQGTFAAPSRPQEQEHDFLRWLQGSHRPDISASQPPYGARRCDTGPLGPWAPGIWSDTGPVGTKPFFAR